MVVSNEDRKPTHDDWLRAKSKRDVAAWVTVKRLLEGDVEVAKTAAEEYQAHDREMDRISAILDDE